MATSKNNASPTKVVSLRLPMEDYKQYASEASALGVDLSPHLMEKLKEFEEVKSMNKALENGFFDVTDERDNLLEEKINLKSKIEALQLNVSNLTRENITIKSDNKRAIETAKLTADNLLKIEKEKLEKCQKEYALSLSKKEETLSANEREIADLKQEQIDTMKKWKIPLIRLLIRHTIIIGMPLSFIKRNSLLLRSR
ncbi:MAG: hypothetical protein MUF58_12935 [Arcicella sp.]|jgi:hypothetical protein|nr:hypothetical protein [Arcicella sp.]